MSGIAVYFLFSGSAGRKQAEIRLITKASDLERHGANVDALAVLNQAKRFSPNNAAVEYQIGCIQIKLHRPSEAIQSFVRAGELGYEFPDLICLGLSRSYLMLNDIENSKRYLKSIDRLSISEEYSLEYDSIREKIKKLKTEKRINMPDNQ